MFRLKTARKSYRCSIIRKNYCSFDNDSKDYVPEKKKGFTMPPLSASEQDIVKKMKEKLTAKKYEEDPIFQEEIELDLDNLEGIEPPTLVMRAIRYIGTNRLDDAIKILEKCIEKSPGLSIAHATLGHAYRAKGDLIKARILFRKAIVLTPTNVDALIGLANVDIVEKNYEDAMRSLTEALKLDENYATTHSTFGILYDKMGNPKEAIKHHKKAVHSGTDIKDPQPFSILGELLAREGEFEDSLIYLNKSIKIDPFFGSGFVALVLVNLELKNWRLCEEYAVKILKITKSEELMKKQQGHTDFNSKVAGLIQYLATKGKEAIQRNDFDLALRLSELCLIFRPREEEFLLLNALAYFNANKLDDAVAKLNFTLSMHPKSYYALSMMSEVKAKLGETVEAFQFLMKAQAADPKKAQVDQNINE
jgi:tetratricopeptide (TPR) repeat protein